MEADGEDFEGREWVGGSELVTGYRVPYREYRTESTVQRVPYRVPFRV